MSSVILSDTLAGVLCGESKETAIAQRELGSSALSLLQTPALFSFVDQIMQIKATVYTTPFDELRTLLSFVIDNGSMSAFCWL